MCHRGDRMKKWKMAAWCFLVSGVISWSTAQAREVVEAGAGYHQVQPGDTLWRLAEEYFGEADQWQVLQHLNQEVEPRLLQPGAVIDLGLTMSPFPAEVLHVEGEVRLSDPGVGTTFLMSGMAVTAGQWVETGAYAFVTLLFQNGERVVLPSQSRAMFSEGEFLGDVKIHLDNGEIESYVPKERKRKPNFEVITPGGILGVRGTHFRVLNRADDTRTSILEGGVSLLPSVSMTLASMTPLSAGKGALLTGAGDLQVVDLLPAPALQESHREESDQLRLVLSPVSGAQSYRIQLAGDPGFSTIVRDITSSVGEAVFDELPEGFYHVRVSATDSLGIEGWYRHHLVFHRPIVVQVASDDSGHTFGWTEATGAHYQLQLASDEAFSDLLVDLVFEENSGVRLRRIPPGNIYWRLLVSDAGSEGEARHVAGTGILNVARQ